MNSLLIIKWLLNVDVMRLSLSLGAWWPGAQWMGPDGLIKSNQIKSLLLSHHHSTSALVSEILMSVLQTVQKNNRQFTYGQTVQKKTTNNLHMDRQCKKNSKQLTYGQTVQKTTNNLHMDRQCKKKQQLQFTYGQTVQKNNSNLHMDSNIFTDCTEDNVQNTHTYTQYA